MYHLFSHKYFIRYILIMAEVSKNIKYVKLDDGVSFSLVRTNPKLTTNTKLMYNGKRMFMESYASSELMNRSTYKNVPVKPNSTYNKDIAGFLRGSGSQAYNVYQNFSDVAISDSYDNQFETLYWCGAEYIDSSFYTEEIGFVAPLYLREKLPNYFLIFRLDTPSNFNLNIDEETKEQKDPLFDFKTDILDKAVLIKTFDLREGTVLGNYIHNYVEQDGFEFDKSMYVNFSNGEVTYYGINRTDGVLEKKVENFENELLKNDNPILKNDKWFTEGFERNGLIFPYIMNIEFLFDDDNFKNNSGEIYDFARYIGLYCNNIEFGEFADFSELNITEDNVIYYFEDNNKNLHRYVKKISNDDNGESDDSNINDEYEIIIDGKDIEYFNRRLISGFEKERITGYAEPLDKYEGFINRAQYGFEILKPFEPGDWVGINYNGHVECYFADDKNIIDDIKNDMSIGEYDDFRFSVSKNSTVNDIAEALVKSVNRNKKSKFEARCSDNVVVIYAKRENDENNDYNNAKMLIESSLFYNRKISIPISNNIKYIDGNDVPIEYISDSDDVISIEDSDGNITNDEKSLFGNYYEDNFYGACDVYEDVKTGNYKNVFKIYEDERIFFNIDRYLKTVNGNGRKILANIAHINAEGKIDPKYRLVIVDGTLKSSGYDVSVSSTCQVEILDKFKPNYGVLSWFPVKDFDFDINYSSYGQYDAFASECKKLSKKVVYTKLPQIEDTYADSDYRSTQEDTTNGIQELPKSPFFDDYGNFLDTEYEYYFEQIHPDLCLMSKTAPYISKWGYYDEQKDSCENPYRLNVSKIFGVSNLSANTYLRNCDETEYTHNMPYYMTLNKLDYSKEYQYILTDDIYINHNNDTTNFETFADCVDYWVNVFKKTDVDWFSYFFSGKKYGKQFDRKYSRLLGGDKFHNPSTLFRGVKFEAVRQYNGIEKRSSEYNDYKFSFVYIPVMVKSMVFNSTVHFVKNDEFKFIVGIIFVNTMLGIYDHNIFSGSVDYFNKGFLYATCKDIIRPENIADISFELTYNNHNNIDDDFVFVSKKSDFWKGLYDIGKEQNIFHVWFNEYGGDGYLSINENVSDIGDIKGNFNIVDDGESDSDSQSINDSIETIDIFKNENKESVDNKYVDDSSDGVDRVQFLWDKKYEEYDIEIYESKRYEYEGEISCGIIAPNIDFYNLIFIDVCDIEYDSFNEENSFVYSIDVSNLHFKSESIQNILINMGEDSVESICFYNYDGNDENDTCEHNGTKFINGENGNCVIKVDINSGDIIIEPKEDNDINTTIIGSRIEDLRVHISIKDKFDTNFDSLGLKNYFTIFNQLSMYSITESVNNDYNVKYHSTVEDNKYKIRILEPDSIEINDIYEAVPIEVTQNNKSVIGSIEIKEKTNVDKIGVKVINRYSGFYNPIFNNILYFDDYTYTKNVGRIKNSITYELPYSNTNIDYNYINGYNEFGIIRNVYFHKTNTSRSDKILTSVNPVYPAINEYALDYRDYNIFSSSWDDGYFISQDDLDTRSFCEGIGSMKDGLCMFGSKYLNLPDDIFIDTFENGKIWDEKVVVGIRDNTDSEIMYKEINNRTVRYHLFIEKRLKRYLKESLIGVFEKYINKEYSFGNKGTIEDDVEEYVEKNLLRLYKVDKVYMYIKSDKMRINDKRIENEYLKYVDIENNEKIKNGFQVITIDGKNELKPCPFIMSKSNEFDRIITYNLKAGIKESFGFGVSFKRK